MFCNIQKKIHYFWELLLYLTSVKLFYMTVTMVSFTVCIAAYLLASSVFKEEFWNRCLSQACWSSTAPSQFDPLKQCCAFNLSKRFLLLSIATLAQHTAVQQLPVFIGLPATLLRALYYMKNGHFNVNVNGLHF